MKPEILSLPPEIIELILLEVIRSHPRTCYNLRLVNSIFKRSVDDLFFCRKNLKNFHLELCRQALPAHIYLEQTQHSSARGLDHFLVWKDWIHLNHRMSNGHRKHLEIIQKVFSTDFYATISACTVNGNTIHLAREEVEDDDSLEWISLVGGGDNEEEDLWYLSPSIHIRSPIQIIKKMKSVLFERRKCFDFAGQSFELDHDLLVTGEQSGFIQIYQIKPPVQVDQEPRLEALQNIHIASHKIISISVYKQMVQISWVDSVLVLENVHSNDDDNEVCMILKVSSNTSNHGIVNLDNQLDDEINKSYFIFGLWPDRKGNTFQSLQEEVRYPDLEGIRLRSAEPLVSGDFISNLDDYSEICFGTLAISGRFHFFYGNVAIYSNFVEHYLMILGAEEKSGDSQIIKQIYKTWPIFRSIVSCVELTSNILFLGTQAGHVYAYKLRNLSFLFQLDLLKWDWKFESQSWSPVVSIQLFWSKTDEESSTPFVMVGQENTVFFCDFS